MAQHFSTMSFTKRIYAILLSLVALWCALIVLAPTAATMSEPGKLTASVLYGFLSRICHQIDARSFHLMGEKFGVCIRCTALYFSFFVGLVFYPFMRRLGSTEVPRARILILASLPMLIDVALHVTGIHASSTLTRILTGSFLGLTLPYYFLPPLIEALAHLRFRTTSSEGSIDARKA